MESENMESWEFNSGVKCHGPGNKRAGTAGPTKQAK